MAITGSGTEQDPYLVHSYDELKTVTTDNSYCPQYGHRYISLDADINCNDYGADFEWETISLGSNNRGYTLDLNGHTVKNVGVKQNNYLLDASYNGSNVYGEWYADFIGDGKLLNIFTAPSSTAYLIKGRGPANVISNLSLSTNLGSQSCGVFYNTSVENSAIYAEQGQTGGNAIILYSDTDSTSAYCTLNNVDMKLAVTKHFNTHITWTSSSQVGTNALISDSRIQGTIKSNDGLNSGWLSRGKLSNCVVDLDMSEASFGSMSYSYKWSCEDGSNGVINTDNQPSNQQAEAYFTRGMTACTSSEIINGDALRGKGFTVVNVVGD